MRVTPPATGEDDSLTLGALGMLAYLASMLTHEALGHGAACIAAGGHNAMLTGWAEACSLDPLPWYVVAAGPAVQFGMGLLSWLAVRQAAPAATVLRSFLWLFMVCNLLIASGYLAFSGLSAFGDGAVLIAGLTPAWFWRATLVLVGALAYYGSMWASALELERILGRTGYPSLRRFLWTPYLAAGLLACCAGALNRTMAPGLALELAALSSLGAGFGMVRVPDLQRAAMRIDAHASYVRRSPAWIVATLVIGVAFLWWIGRGLGAR